MNLRIKDKTGKPILEVDAKIDFEGTHYELLSKLATADIEVEKVSESTKQLSDIFAILAFRKIFKK